MFKKTPKIFISTYLIISISSLVYTTLLSHKFLEYLSRMQTIIEDILKFSIASKSLQVEVTGFSKRIWSNLRPFSFEILFFSVCYGNFYYEKDMIRFKQNANRWNVIRSIIGSSKYVKVSIKYDFFFDLTLIKKAWDFSIINWLQIFSHRQLLRRILFHVKLVWSINYTSKLQTILENSLFNSNLRKCTSRESWRRISLEFC